MISQLFTPLALLPQRESDFGDILKILILLALPVLLAVGKWLMEKLKGVAEPTRPGQRRAAGSLPPGVEARPVSTVGVTEEEDEEQVEPEDFWDELVAQATSEPASGGETIVPLPPTADVIERTTRDTPLGVDLDRLDESLPSHHEEYFESHPHADLVPRPEVARPIHPAPVGRERPTTSSRGSALRASIEARDGWRRAIVVAELLGPPLGLRSGEGQPGMR